MAWAILGYSPHLLLGVLIQIVDSQYVRGPKLYILYTPPFSSLDLADSTVSDANKHGRGQKVGVVVKFP